MSSTKTQQKRETLVGKPATADSRPEEPENPLSCGFDSVTGRISKTRKIPKKDSIFRGAFNVRLQDKKGIHGMACAELHQQRALQHSTVVYASNRIFQQEHTHTRLRTASVTRLAMFALLSWRNVQAMKVFWNSCACELFEYNCGNQIAHRCDAHKTLRSNFIYINLCTNVLRSAHV